MVLPTYLPESFGGAEQQMPQVVRGARGAGRRRHDRGSASARGHTERRESTRPDDVSSGFACAGRPNLGGRHSASFLAWSAKLAWWLVRRTASLRRDSRRPRAAARRARRDRRTRARKADPDQARTGRLSLRPHDRAQEAAGRPVVLRSPSTGCPRRSSPTVAKSSPICTRRRHRRSAHPPAAQRCRNARRHRCVVASASSASRTCGSSTSGGSIRRRRSTG